MQRKPRRPLQLMEQLRPAWVAVGEGRSRMGVELDCPTHPGDHRVAVWLDNPGDGGEPHPSAFATALEGDGEGFEDLTLIPARSGCAHEGIHLGHWFGWVIHGELVPAGHWRGR